MAIRQETIDTEVGYDGKYGSYNALACSIVIYEKDASGKDVKKYVINEVVNVTLKDSYENLTNTAEVTFPREIEWESPDGKTEGKNMLGVNGSVFNKGDRITILLGYGDKLKVMFDGYIVSVIPKTPFTLKCEDKAWILKHNSIDYVSEDITHNVYNMLSDVILKGTGILPHPLMRTMDTIELGAIEITKGQSSAHILSVWKKRFGLLSFIKDGYLVVARTFFSTNDDTLLTGNITSPPTLYFNERTLGNVVKDNLSFTSIDYSDLAVKGTAIARNNSRKEVFVVIDPTNPKTTMLLTNKGVSVRSVAKGKKAKIKALNIYEKDKDFVKGKAIRTVQYYNISEAELISRTKSVFFKFTQTGIEGSVTTFGDYGLKSAMLVRLQDVYNPEKNGAFIVSEVLTKFGTSGYRQTVKMPYKYSN